MENDYLWFGLAGVCVLLMLTGIILLLTCTRRKHSASGRRNYGCQPVPTTVHSIDDLPLDFERAVERPRPVQPRPVAQTRMPAQDFNIQRLSPDPEDRVLPARPVSPLTSWDPIKPAPTFKTLQDFSQGEMGDPTPATQERPLAYERPKVQERPVPQEKPVAYESLLREKPAAPKVPAFDNDERLLLLKSHELLLTLSEGLKKLSSAKTDASRKEKIAEMMKAVSLLDAKNAWDEYKACFDKINPEFWARIEKTSEEPMLPYELRLCALLAMGMSAKDAAELTNRSVRTVETSIYKIRKKLNIDAEEKTQDYLKRML
ncbi:MAG: hypothetical protein K2I66_04230 [Bacteroidales bacterium]|nr:hypothetical protein [Bacteroidales bacterium]